MWLDGSACVEVAAGFARSGRREPWCRTASVARPCRLSRDPACRMGLGRGLCSIGAGSCCQSRTHRLPADQWNQDVAPHVTRVPLSGGTACNSRDVSVGIMPQFGNYRPMRPLAQCAVGASGWRPVGAAPLLQFGLGNCSASVMGSVLKACAGSAVHARYRRGRSAPAALGWAAAASTDTACRCPRCHPRSGR